MAHHHPGEKEKKFFFAFHRLWWWCRKQISTFSVFIFAYYHESVRRFSLADKESHHPPTNFATNFHLSRNFLFRWEASMNKKIISFYEFFLLLSLQAATIELDKTPFLYFWELFSRSSYIRGPNKKANRLSGRERRERKRGRTHFYPKRKKKKIRLEKKTKEWIKFP